MELLDAPLERSPEPSTVDGVAVVRWPDERARAEELARRSAPRLLLVAVDTEPPVGNDPLCDWVQEPADELDVQSRIVALRNRASIERPILGDHGVVWRGGVWVPLSPIEARLDRRVPRPPGSGPVAPAAGTGRVARRTAEQSGDRRAHQGAARARRGGRNPHTHRAGPGLPRRDPGAAGGGGGELTGPNRR